MAQIYHKNQSVSTHEFAMVPKSEVSRSTFLKQHTHKTTFDENYLVPIYVDEVLPGDMHQLKMTAFARLSTPIYPVMDNMYLDSFFFFVPSRLVWSHWVNFMGEQANPADSISFTVPVCNPAAGYATGSLQDYFGLPNVGQIAASAFTHSALPLRCYNLIWNQWFRDENLQNSVGFGATNTVGDFGDGPDPTTNYALLKRGKRHDYFTSCLPWTQKGGASVNVPLAGSALVKTSASETFTGVQTAVGWRVATTGNAPTLSNALGMATQAPGTAMGVTSTATTGVTGGLVVYPTNLYADLTTATGATINALRQSFQIQKLLERDARGGTRYTELLRAHFGVISPDARLQRPEYLGGGTTPVNVAPIAQTSATGVTGSTTPLGNLSAFGTLLSQGNGFSQSFTEHGYIIGLVNVRADITYQQGLRKLWARSTRYDFFWPEFSMLGEQAVLNQEIYMVGGATTDSQVFGYQMRWDEYRYMPSMITGQFRSTYATPLDTWHLAEKFTSLPTLAATFIQSNVPVSRVVAVASPGAHFIFDGFFDVKCTRPMPMFSVPGLIDHF